jgi:hypothetical protein
MTTPTPARKIEWVPLRNQGKARAWMLKTAPDTVLAFVTKYPNTRTETHPYKVFGAKLSKLNGFVFDDTVFSPVYGSKLEAQGEALKICKPVKF